jgi:SAM-dependent methyltransferase
MLETRLWTFMGGAGSPWYRCFDAVRRGLNRRLYRYLSSRALGHGQSRVLEAGSGPAFTSSLLSSDPLVSLSVAVDIDLTALQEARKRDPALPVVVGDLYHLPFADGVFDLVWSSSTLEHLERPQVVLAEMKRVAKSGGKMFIGVPYKYGPLVFQPWIKATRVGIWLGPVFDRRRLREMLTQLGLSAEEFVLYFFWFFVGVLAEKR